VDSLASHYDSERAGAHVVKQLRALAIAVRAKFANEHRIMQSQGLLRPLTRLLKPLHQSSVLVSRPLAPQRAFLHISPWLRHEASSAHVQLQDRRLRMTFTCTAPICTDPGVRSTHEFSRHAYEKGIVLVQCPGCKTRSVLALSCSTWQFDSDKTDRHLIADHLGWFNDDDLTEGGKYRTIEDIMRAKGEQVKRGNYLVDDGNTADGNNEGETVSFVPPEDAPK
jgi:mitochondrial protein import protein ZIM17